MKISIIRFLVPATLVLAAAFVVPGAARAQTELSFGGGIMDYDLAGTGQTLTLNARAVMPLSRTFALEPGIVWAQPELQGGGGATLLIPEVQLQASFPIGPVAPYLGLGVGAALAFADDDSGGNDQEIAFSGGAGLRVDAGGLLGLVVDGRVHGFGTSFGGSTAELTVGLRIRR